MAGARNRKLTDEKLTDLAESKCAEEEEVPRRAANGRRR